MTFLFWAFWTIDLLLLLLAVAGKGFRSSFGAGVDLNVLIIIVVLLILIASLVARFGFKQKGLSLLMVSLPLVAMLAMYLFEKLTGKPDSGL